MPRNKEEKRAYDRKRYHEQKERFALERKVYYEKNKEQILERTRKWTVLRIEKHKNLARELKSKPCMDCGQQFHHCAMDFDHRPDEVKWDSISSLVQNWKISERVLLEEIAKCDVVCAVCHRIRTHERGYKNA